VLLRFCASEESIHVLELLAGATSAVESVVEVVSVDTFLAFSQEKSRIMAKAEIQK
jgi:hypothetical protein